MTTGADDEGTQAVRDVREKISAECANDAKTIVDHYLAEQERYQNRLLRPASNRRIDSTEAIPSQNDAQP